MGHDNPNHMLNIVNKGAEWVGLKKPPRSLGGVLCIVLTAHLIFYKSLSILTHFLKRISILSVFSYHNNHKHVLKFSVREALVLSRRIIVQVFFID